MSLANPSHAPGAPARPPGMSLDDVLYTLFRHKWLILAFFCLGLAGIVAVCLVRPPLYVSKAKIMVHYVKEIQPMNPADPETQGVRTIDPGVQGIIASEIEILTSLDVATQTVHEVGPEKILARKGGGDNPLAAAAVVASGIDVEPPRSTVITISFKHPDKDVVQPVLGALIQNYMHQHLVVRQGLGVVDVYYSKQAVELRQRLKQTEEELKHLKSAANVLYMDETKKSFQAQITKTKEQLLDAERELAEHKAVLGGLGALEPDAATQTNGLASANASVPPSVLTEYSELTAELDRLKKDERELLRLYKEAYPTVQRTRAQIEKLTRQKTELERANPALSYIVMMTSRASGTNTAGADVASELNEIRRLNARVITLGGILSNIQNEAALVMDAEPKITEMQRQHDEQQKHYDFVVRSLESTHNSQSQQAGTANNISIVQNPTPASLDTKKLYKLLLAVFAGCFGMGLGLAFALDFVLDRSIKRPVDIDRHLRLPLFLTIPDTTWNGGSALAAVGPDRQLMSPDHDPKEGQQMAVWDPGSPLKPYSEGLRERLMTYFEVRNMNLKKPKLVGVTACNKGAGVSTLASGLAAELSRTGDGNVLLVDVHGEQGMAHPFHRGRPGCGLSEVLEPDGRAEAQVNDKLFVASMMKGEAQSLSPVIPTRFSQMVPKLKASDYDYIIFDMPPVSAISTTPRLASHMDLVLLVLESEQTSQQVAARANALMTDSRANVAAVLNKYRPHVPAPLSQEA